MMYSVWLMSCKESEMYYLNLLEKGATPEQARSVLPNSLKTELIITANLREWRHIFKLRTSNNAHPQCRQLLIRVLQGFKKVVPVVFDDIGGW